ncbi:hypothetical protein [Actinokineospora bangkokensis]|uniref:Uncharacterized protein n=1 Tax=Actinokineospora bangkokensis TaxID=1193682 RepID=A0A1Q9LQQ1_9PSEU|nr:hypothetical protein [Actinokineospora bangkokensis]OLR94355.1 hypothetical protein BJP25_11350 [Actinokineospora bangkokensis]
MGVAQTSALGGAVAVAALLLGVLAQNRGWRLASAVAYGIAGGVGALTTGYAVSGGTFDGGWYQVWTLLPLAFTVLVWWLGHRQAGWMRRLGVVLDEGTAPSFGVLPGPVAAVAHDDPAGRFTTAVEFTAQGHRVLAAQYTSHTSDRPGVRPGGRLDQAITLVDATCALVQVRVPRVPAVVLTPVPGHHNPAEDARTTRNLVGAVRPDAVLHPVEGAITLADRFEVHAEDPDAARLLLTPRVQEAIAGDPWCRVRPLALAHGALWTTEAGHLTETAALDGSRHLARLAAVVPWDDADYAATAAAADTSAAAWYGGRRRLLARVNDRRLAADRPPLSAGSLARRLLVLTAVDALCLGAATQGAQQAFAGVLVAALATLVVVRWTFFPKRQA